MQNPGQGSILFPGGIEVYEYITRQETDIGCGAVVVVGHHRHQLWSSLASTVVVLVSRQRCRHQPWLAVVVVAVIGSHRQSWSSS
jgi:hypothetical protein